MEALDFKIADKLNGNYIFKDNDYYILYNIVCELNPKHREKVLHDLSGENKVVSLIISNEYDFGFIYKDPKAEDNKLIFVYSKLRESILNFLIKDAKDNYSIDDELLSVVAENLLTEDVILKFKKRKMENTLNELNTKFKLNLKL